MEHSRVTIPVNINPAINGKTAANFSGTSISGTAILGTGETKPALNSKTTTAFTQRREIRFPVVGGRGCHQPAPDRSLAEKNRIADASDY